MEQLMILIPCPHSGNSASFRVVRKSPLCMGYAIGLELLGSVESGQQIYSETL